MIRQKDSSHRWDDVVVSVRPCTTYVIEIFMKWFNVDHITIHLIV